MLKFKLNDEYLGSEIVTQKDNVYEIKYPCSLSHECSSIKTTFPAGVYKIELYGGSGGYKEGFMSTFIEPFSLKCSNENVTKYQGNTNCVNKSSLAGAGGYTSAYLSLRRRSKIFIAIGGKGNYSWGNSNTDENRPKGGFNGGGRGTSFYYYDDADAGSSGGGGATDIRIDADDYWHRVIVSGGGGGSDNENLNRKYNQDNGAGGSGGGLIAQGFWVNSVYNPTYVATQTTGFSFGNGEAAQNSGSKADNGLKSTDGSSDRAGAGGGWFGGFSSHNGNGGGGGGSSFAFTKDAIVPKGDIPVFDDFYEPIGSHPYAFSHANSFFTVNNPVFVPGIWAGNGFARITYISSIKVCTSGKRIANIPFMTMILICRS